MIDDIFKIKDKKYKLLHKKGHSMSFKSIGINCENCFKISHETYLKDTRF